MSSFRHKKRPDNLSGRICKMVRPAGFEPATARLEGVCSIQLSYGRMSQWSNLF